MLLLLAATALSVSAGVPAELPGVALGWPLLLHLERGALLVAGLSIVVLVGTRAAMGRFPSRLGQIEYAVGRVVGDFSMDAGVWEERLGKVESTVERLDQGRE